MTLWALTEEIWHHDCPEKGERLLFTREQLGVYFLSAQGKELVSTSAKGKWEYDSAGCPWCNGLPAELAAVVAIVNQRREKYAKRKILD
jgi:hypothetical protein